MPAAPLKQSDWRPLAHPVFRALWIATVVSNVGIILMPRVQRRLSTDRMVGCATAVFSTCILGLATCRRSAPACAIAFIIGANWVVILTNFNIATQLAVPAWVKGRAMSMYLLTLWGSWALGAAFWGKIAQRTSPHVAMIAAGSGLALGLAAMARYRLIPPAAPAGAANDIVGLAAPAADAGPARAPGENG